MANYSVLHSGYHHNVLRTWQSSETIVTPANLMYPIFITYVSTAYRHMAILLWFEHKLIEVIYGHGRSSITVSSVIRLDYIIIINIYEL